MEFPASGFEVTVDYLEGKLNQALRDIEKDRMKHDQQILDKAREDLIKRRKFFLRRLFVKYEPPTEEDVKHFMENDRRHRGLHWINYPSDLHYKSEAVINRLQHMINAAREVGKDSVYVSSEDLEHAWPISEEKIR